MTSARITELGRKFEEKLDVFATPFKPYIPAIGRFLLVVTFLEDAVRIVSQWSDQRNYLERQQRFPVFLSILFLTFNVAVQFVSPLLVVGRRWTEYAVGSLFIVVIAQALGYGLVFDFAFLFRNLSVIGGLFMLLSEAAIVQKKKESSQLFAGLPSLSERDRSAYLQLFGRILLVFLFVSLMFAGEMDIFRIIFSVAGLVACFLVVIGFKAKYSAIFLVAGLSIANFLLNNWWSLHHNHPKRDFLKYDFFQILSIVGGLILLASVGPGGISMDEKKKSF